MTLSKTKQLATMACRTPAFCAVATLQGRDGNCTLLTVRRQMTNVDTKLGMSLINRLVTRVSAKLIGVLALLYQVDSVVRV